MKDFSFNILGHRKEQSNSRGLSFFVKLGNLRVEKFLKVKKLKEKRDS